MFTNNIKIGTEVSYYERKHIIIDFVPPTLYLKRIGDGALNEVSLTDFQNNGRIIYDTDADIEDTRQKYMAEPLSEKEQKVVDKRMNIIKPVLDFNHAKEIGAISCFIEEYPELLLSPYNAATLTQEKVISAVVRFYSKTDKSISSRTLKRYLKEYRDSERKGLDGKIALRPKTGDRVKKRKDIHSLVICKPNKPDEISDVINVRINPEQIAILKDKIEKDFLKIGGITVAELIDIVNVKCYESEIEPLKPSTVYSIINRYDEAEIIRYRGSKKEVLNKVTDFERGFTHENGRYPLHYVAIDHQKLDVLVVDESGRVIGRAWITAAIDLYTRMIWGCHISFNEPSINKVIKVLKHGMLPKNTIEQFDTQNDYVICGKPEYIMFDNGPDFKSEEIQHMVTDVIGSTVLYRPVRTPHYSGVVERWFGTLNTELIHRLPGTTKSNPQKLGDVQPENLAKYTLPELEKIIMTYIVDVYHVSRHKGLKGKANTPMKAYLKGIALHGIPRYVTPEAQKTLNFELMRQEKRRYRGDGITFGKVRYKCDELIGLIKPIVEYTIKYDDDDISTILLLHPKENRYIVVPAVEPRREVIAGMNRYYYNWLLQLMDDEEKETMPNEKSILKAKAKLQMLIDKKYKRSALVRKQTEIANIPYDYNDTIKDEKPKKDEILALIEEEIMLEKKTEEKIG